MENKPMLDVLDILHGRWRSQILYAGVKLGIFDFLKDQANSAIEAASTLNLNTGMTYRLLRALACTGLLKESEDHIFSITASGEYLCGNHPQTLRSRVLLEEGPQHYAIWKHFTDIVRESGKNGFVREYGHPIFEHTVHDHEYGDVFNHAMISYSSSETELAVEALTDYDFSAINTLCDVGGGYGHLLSNLLIKHPHLKGILYDLPYIFEDTDQLMAKQYGIENRIDNKAGDMFKVTPSADAYIMKHILHDWNDEECLQILSNMSQAAHDNAKLFIVECIVPGTDTPHFAKLFDIHMMCATGGMERTEKEYAVLFEQSGWKYIKTWYPKIDAIGVVEAKKV
jgi:hypothetical protein